MNMDKVFVGISTEKWFLYVDVERVESGELMAIMPAERLLDKNEVAIDSVLVDGDTKALTIEEGLETEVVVKKTKKRKIESSDGKKSQKKSKIILNQSVVARTSSRDVVDESHELGENVQVEVAMTESLAVSPRDKSDDILAGAIVKVARKMALVWDRISKLLMQTCHAKRNLSLIIQSV